MMASTRTLEVGVYGGVAVAPALLPLAYAGLVTVVAGGRRLRRVLVGMLPRQLSELLKPAELALSLGLWCGPPWNRRLGLSRVAEPAG